MVVWTGKSRYFTASTEAREDDNLFPDILSIWKLDRSLQYVKEVYTTAKV